jgi:hypothetical protein
MPDQTLMAALIAAALGGAEPVLPEPPPFTRYPDEAYPIVSQFGSWKGIGGGRREAPNEGVDVIARVRTPVHAAAYGVVRRVAVERERGRVVEIETTGTQPDYVMVYTHLHAATVAPGQPVRAGEPIGAVGDTGQVPRGIAFLHFELRRTDGRAVNPEPLFRSRPEGRGAPVPLPPGGEGAMRRPGEGLKAPGCRRLRPRPLPHHPKWGAGGGAAALPGGVLAGVRSAATPGTARSRVFW